MSANNQLFRFQNVLPCIYGKLLTVIVKTQESFILNLTSIVSDFMQTQSGGTDCFTQAES